MLQEICNQNRFDHTGILAQSTEVRRVVIITKLCYNIIVATPNVPSSIPPGIEAASTGPSVAQMAESAVSSVESSIVKSGLGMVVFGIGIGIFLYKRGIEAILFQKNPFRGIGKTT